MSDNAKKALLESGWLLKENEDPEVVRELENNGYAMGRSITWAGGDERKRLTKGDVR